MTYFSDYFSDFENVLKGDETGQGTSQLGRSKFNMLSYVAPKLLSCVGSMLNTMLNMMLNTIVKIV